MYFLQKILLLSRARKQAFCRGFRFYVFFKYKGKLYNPATIKGC